MIQQQAPGERKDLLEATKYMMDFTGNIAGTLGSLGKLVLGGD